MDKIDSKNTMEKAEARDFLDGAVRRDKNSKYHLSHKWLNVAREVPDEYRQYLEENIIDAEPRDKIRTPFTDDRGRKEEMRELAEIAGKDIVSDILKLETEEGQNILSCTNVDGLRILNKVAPDAFAEACMHQNPNTGRTPMHGVRAQYLRPYVENPGQFVRGSVVSDNNGETIIDAAKGVGTKELITQTIVTHAEEYKGVDDNDPVRASLEQFNNGVEYLAELKKAVAAQEAANDLALLEVAISTIDKMDGQNAR